VTLDPSTALGAGRTIVVGSMGQVGRALTSLLGERARPVTREELDLGVPERVKVALDDIAREVGRPAAVLNAAAYTRVDDAEANEALALRVNAESPRLMAEWCGERGIPFVHYSTDYVYPGTGERPWTEDDPPAPPNAYGRTKLQGDRFVTAAGGPHLILRTSWVYDAHGRNFFRTILRLARERDVLRVVDDQVGAPSYAPHLARGTVMALTKSLGMARFPSGIYHLANRGTVSWHGFAQRICAGARQRGMAILAARVDAAKSAEYPVVARRPLNSRLDVTRVRDVLGVELPAWESALEDCFEELEV
jgi:dTDP-4-dehydrorhamnose reductase